MTQSLTTDDVQRLIRKAATVWDSMRFDTETCRTWVEALTGMTAAQATAALAHHTKHVPHAPKPADLRAALRALTAGTTHTEEPRPGGPRSKPSCSDCHHGWIEAPPILERSYPRDRATGEPIPGAEPVVTRYPEVVRPCPRCNADTHQRWGSGQYTSEARR